jgi:hypothetical protein
VCLASRDERLGEATVMRVVRDPWAELASAHQSYVRAMCDRDGAAPGSPEYRDAVRRVSTEFGRVRRLAVIVRSAPYPWAT